MKPFYRVQIVEHWEPGNRHFYSYDAKIIEFTPGSEDTKTVWSRPGKKRRALKAIADEECAKRNLEAKEVVSGRRKASSLLTWAPKDGPLPRTGKGMTGRVHSPEARRAIAESVRKRWAEGAYKDAKLGRPTAPEQEQRATAKQAREDAVKQQLDQQRAVERKQMDARQAERTRSKS